MSAKSVVEFTTGQPGSGKSYRRCAWLILKRVLNPEDKTINKIWSNYPIMFEPWTDGHGVEQPGLLKMAEDLYGLDEWEVRDKVRVFPPDEVDTWFRYDAKQEPRGPWSYFGENDLHVDGWHIAIDEIHNFCPRGDSKIQTEWNKWLGEIRHEGATIEFITQHPSKVGPAISKHAGIRRQLVTSAGRRDFLFNIPLSDWYNLGTVIGREYRASVWEIEEREVLGKWQVSDQFPFWFDPKYYGCYNTSSASNATGRSGAGGEVKVYQTMTKPAVVKWFLVRNWWRFFYNKTFGMLSFVLFIMFVASNLDTLLPYFKTAMRTKKASAVEADENAAREKLEETQRKELARYEDDQLRREMEKRLQVQNERIEKVVAFADEYDGTDFIVAMTPDHVVFASGQRAVVGDDVRLIDGTILKLVRIEYPRRRVHYDDGSMGWMYNDFGMLSRASKATERSKSVRKYLFAGEVGRLEKSDAGSTGQSEDSGADNDFNGVVGDRGLLPVPGGETQR